MLAAEPKLNDVDGLAGAAEAPPKAGVVAFASGSAFLSASDIRPNALKAGCDAGAGEALACAARAAPNPPNAGCDTGAGAALDCSAGATFAADDESFEAERNALAGLSTLLTGSALLSVAPEPPSAEPNPPKENADF